MLEKKVVKLVAIMLVSCMVLMCTALFYLPELRGAVGDLIHRNDTSRFSMEQLFGGEAVLVPKDVEAVDEDLSEFESHIEKRLAFDLPDGVKATDISITNDYLTRTITMAIPRADESYFNSRPLSGSSLHIEEISTEPGPIQGTIEIHTDKVYELSCYYTDTTLYMDFVDPHEVYDYVVVIDPGHGGRVPGTVKGGYSEKDINLAIALELRAALMKSDLNIGVYCTRTDDTNPDFPERVALANESDADVFVSIHNNSMAGRGRATTKGVEALYNEEDASGQSLALATLLQDYVSVEAGAVNRGVVKGADIYVVRNCNVPATLVEVGFMTHGDELKKLASAQYQWQVGQALCHGIEDWLLNKEKK